MPLYLVQHSLSLTREQDPQRGLSDEGVSLVKKIAEKAKKKGLQVSRIFHSGKMRARQTAELLAAELAPAEGVEETSGLGPMDDVEMFAAGLDASANWMLVGHLPFMARMAACLVAGSADATVFRFQNGCILCLDADESGGWLITDVVRE